MLRGLAACLALAGACISAQAAVRECSYRVESRVLYAYGQLEQGVQQPLLLDAYLPTACTDGAPGRVPPIVLIPGGGFNWVQRDRPRIVEIADGLARAGYAVFPIEHRVRTWNGLAAVSETMDPEEQQLYKKRIIKSPYPADQHFQALVAMEDAFKAEAWIRERAELYQLDIDHLGLLGGSSGACTVLGMEYSSEEMGFAGSTAKAVVDMWGDFFPHSDMKAGDAPVLVLAGTEDPVIAYDLTTDIMTRARKVKVDASRITMPGVKHGLDDADIFNRHVVGTDLTVFQGIVQFLDAKLRVDGRVAWPPSGQTREMVAEEYPAPTP